MVIYGVALLSFCMLVGVFLGDILGKLIGVQASASWAARCFVTLQLSPPHSARISMS